MADAIGIMEGAFFVSRNELLNWINDLLKLNLAKIEQLGTGAVYCQIIDSCFPGEVSMHKVNWKAKFEWEFVNNFKILQQAFVKCNIQKQIEIDKLVKAKYQDNLEFGQWMKRYHEIKFGKDGGKNYDALSRRGKIQPDFSYIEKGAFQKSNSSSLTHQDPRKSKSKEEPQLIKKIKLNNSSSKNSILNKSFIKEDNNKTPVTTQSLMLEKQELEAKLKHIENLIEHSGHKEDSQIVKSIRDYLGVLVQPALDLNHSMDLDQFIHQDSLIDCGNFITKQLQGDEPILLVEGESIQAIEVDIP